MGGVGKTTLARALCDKLHPIFPGRRIYFEVGVQTKDLHETNRELHDKRCKLIQQLSDAAIQPSFGCEATERNRLRNALCSWPVLLVLDDLWTRKQLHWLLACDDTDDPSTTLENLHKDSRVILTSRDIHVVTLKGYEDGLIEHTILDDNSSQQMLCQEAFRASAPPPEFTHPQLQQALDICGGLPLALEVLGRQLRDASSSDWQVCLSA